MSSLEYQETWICTHVQRLFVFPGLRVVVKRREPLAEGTLVEIGRGPMGLWPLPVRVRSGEELELYADSTWPPVSLLNARITLPVRRKRGLMLVYEPKPILGLLYLRRGRVSTRQFG